MGHLQPLHFVIKKETNKGIKTVLLNSISMSLKDDFS